MPDVFTVFLNKDDDDDDDDDDEPHWPAPGGGGYSCEFWIGVCHEGS